MQSAARRLATTGDGVVGVKLLPSLVKRLWVQFVGFHSPILAPEVRGAGVRSKTTLDLPRRNPVFTLYRKDEEVYMYLYGEER